MTIVPMDLVTPAYRAASLVAQSLPGGVVDAAAPRLAGLLAAGGERPAHDGRAPPAPGRPSPRGRGPAPAGAAGLRLLRPLLRRVVPAAVHRPRRARRPHELRGVRARRAGGRQGHRPAAVPAAPRELGVERLLAHPGAEAPGHGRRRAHRAPGAVRLVRRVPRAHRHAHRSARAPRPAGRPWPRSRRATSSPCCAIATSAGAASRSPSSASGRRCPRVPAVLALRTGAPLLPDRDVRRGPRPPRRDPAARARRAAGHVPRRRRPHHPGAGRPSSRP